MLRTKNQRSGKSALLWRYLIPVFGVAIAILIRAAAQKVIENDTPFLLLFAVVLASAAFGGLGPGLLTTLLAALSSSLLFHDVNLSDGITVAEALRLMLFFVEGAFISVLGARLQAARRRAEQSEAEARELEQKILDISDAERHRFGQDLHDGLGQTLTGVAFLSKALQQRLAAQALPEASDATQIATLVSQSIGQTRALAKGLAPVGLEDGGLASALTQLATTTSTIFNLKCELIVSEFIELHDLPVATHLYRIAQEAINNATRHGHPKTITLRFSSTVSGLKLQIDDDGIGFSPSPDHSGMGLQIMQFRAKMINGLLEVRRRDPAGGTRVVFTAPALIRNEQSNDHQPANHV